MKPVMQTKFGKGSGNCLNACIASLLHLKIDQVSHEWKGPHWVSEVRDWLYERGHTMMLLSPRDEVHCASNIDYIACGQSPREIKHAVIMRGVMLVHDPHPDGGGIGEIEDVIAVFPNGRYVWKGLSEK